MLRHLIDDYREQVALKLAERERIDHEISRLRSRVQELESLQTELEKQVEQNPS
jgi:chromosome segregation ATPase